MKSTKSLIRVHQGGEVVAEEKRVMYFDDVTYAWYIMFNKKKVFVYPECDGSGDTWATPYSREAALAYTYHENSQVIDDGIVTRTAVYWRKGDTSTVWALDGRPVAFSFKLNAYVVVAQEPHLGELEADLEGETLTPAQASEAAAVALALIEEDLWVEAYTEAVLLHREPPPLSPLLSCLLAGRRIREDLARIRANMNVQREAEPFTAF